VTVREYKQLKILDELTLLLCGHVFEQAWEEFLRVLDQQWINRLGSERGASSLALPFVEVWFEGDLEEEGHRPKAGALVKEVKVCVVLVGLVILTISVFLSFGNLSRLFFLYGGRRFHELFRWSSLFA